MIKIRRVVAVGEEGDDWEVTQGMFYKLMFYKLIGCGLHGYMHLASYGFHCR